MQYYYCSGGNEIQGFITKADFNSLSDNLRKEFLGVIEISDENETDINFTVTIRDEFEHIVKKITNRIRNKVSNERRRLNSQLISEGTYEKEDIDAIFKAQEGLCYYTRKQLSKNPINFVIDHVVPISRGGSHWPGNLVLTLSEINQEKYAIPKNKYFNILEKKYGNEWRMTQRQFCKRVDLDRRKIDKARKKVVSDIMLNIENRLKEVFPEIPIKYALTNGKPELIINYIAVVFPPGFIRQKKVFNSFSYVKNIAYSVLHSNLPLWQEDWQLWGMGKIKEYIEHF